MAAFDHVQNMYDVSLKPRLLRSLVKDHLPDEKHPFRNPLDLSHVVSAVKAHRLLSEVEESSTDRKQIENWKSAVDAWVNRLMMLVSTDMPDKCWAGICLLGVTSQECGSERFLASYSLWFHKLLSHIQSPAESQFVKVASCASMSDLFTRLGRFPNVKKDGTSHAAKLVQPVLKMLNEESPDSVWEGAVCLLCTLITSFPSSVNRHYDSAEAAIVSRIMSGKCSVKMLQKLCHCLALLPKSKGDGDSWSLLMQKILFSINVHLTDAFQGVEEEFRSNEAIRILVPPGKDPPPPLGGQTALELSDPAKTRSQRLLVSSVSALMLSCCTMLTSSYPVQTTVPVRSILVLAGRVLMIDGSFSKAMYPFVTAMQQESVCSELPVLHLYSLELVNAMVKGVRSQLLPHAADIVRLLTEYFSRCSLPELRIKLYSIIKNLLTSMGVGMALYLSQEVIKNVFADLDSVGYDRFFKAYSKVPSEALVQASHRKRKHAGSLEEQSAIVGVEAAATETLAPISVKIAALEALETLLTVAGASRSESWRPDVDRLIVTVAANACKSGFSKEGNSVFLPSEPLLPTWADFQLAALRALLASVISPARVRPPYLAQGLELFHRGIKETGTKVAEFCAHALLALEVLIHPRSLPVIDLTSTNDNPFDGLNRRFPESIYSGSQNLDTSFSGGPPAKGPTDPDSDEDNLYENWLANGDEADVVIAEKPSVTFNEAGNSLAEKVQEESESIRGSNDEVMIETVQFEEIIKQSEETVNREGGTVAAAAAGALGPMDADVALGKDDVADDLATKGDGFVGALSNSALSKRFRFDLEDDSSGESIPDIVDGDPDSD